MHLDDDIYEAARSLAAAEGVSVGKALSRLARRGLAPGRRTRSRRGFPVFDVPAGTSPLTPDMVRKALDEG